MPVHTTVPISDPHPPSALQTPSTMMLPHVRRERAASQQLSPVASSPQDASPVTSPVVRHRKHSTKAKGKGKGKKKRVTQDENAGGEENKGVEAGSDSDNDFQDVKPRAKATKRKSAAGRGRSTQAKKARRSTTSDTTASTNQADTNAPKDGAAQSDAVPEKTPGLLRAARMALARVPAQHPSPTAAPIASSPAAPTPTVATPASAAPPTSEVKKPKAKAKRRSSSKARSKKVERRASTSPAPALLSPVPAARATPTPATPFDASKMIADLKSALGEAAQVRSSVTPSSTAPVPPLPLTRTPACNRQAPLNLLPAHKLWSTPNGCKRCESNAAVVSLRGGQSTDGVNLRRPPPGARPCIRLHRFDELKALRCTEPERALQEAQAAWAKKEAGTLCDLVSRCASA